MADTVRFQRVDATNIEDHSYLRLEDECYYLFEYTSGRNYSFSSTNNLVSNLKKKPSRKGLPDYKYKLQTIRACSEILGHAINPGWLQQATLVPVPPSKVRGEPEFDDRVERICRGIPSPQPLDVREIVVQKASMAAAHEGGERPSVEDLIENYAINEAVTAPVPQRIAIVDDVLTVGTHYRAMHTVLSGRFPDCQIVGFFIARRVFPENRFEEFFKPVE